MPLFEMPFQIQIYEMVCISCRLFKTSGFLDNKNYETNLVTHTLFSLATRKLRAKFEGQFQLSLLIYLLNSFKNMSFTLYYVFNFP